MGDRENEVHPSEGSWAMVAVAWVLVGVPLLWGVFMTLKKAAQLFR
ncbi:MAG: MFS transporter small subunit [Gemmatimonadales bacterium]